MNTTFSVNKVLDTTIGKLHPFSSSQEWGKYSSKSFAGEIIQRG
jgi:hypothetical protein